MKEQTTYNVIIGLDSCGDVIVLDYAFNYDSDNANAFHGVTGSRFYAVPKAEYRESMKRDNIVESLMTCGMEEYSTQNKAIKAYQQMKCMGELEDFVYDPSYSNMHESIREAFGYKEKDYPIITCTGGGRMFNISELAGMTKIVCDMKYIDIIFEFEDMDTEFMNFMLKGLVPMNESLMKARMYKQCMDFKAIMDSKAAAI